jgi:hypothetical protein
MPCWSASADTVIDLTGETESPAAADTNAVRQDTTGQAATASDVPVGAETAPVGLFIKHEPEASAIPMSGASQAVLC